MFEHSTAKSFSEEICNFAEKLSNWPVDVTVVDGSMVSIQLAHRKSTWYNTKRVHPTSYGLYGFIDNIFVVHSKCYVAINNDHHESWHNSNKFHTVSKENCELAIKYFLQGIEVTAYAEIDRIPDHSNNINWIEPKEKIPTRFTVI